jgi:hypothetical protein
MGNRYGQGLGFWNVEVGGADLKLKPRKGDNYELMRIINKKNNDTFMEDMAKFIRNLIARDFPPEDPSENDELDAYIEFNITELIKELMIAFRWSTRDKLENLEAQQIQKNLIDGN